MKNTVVGLTLMICAGLTATAVAGERTGRERGPDARVNHMIEQLQLNDEQAARVRAILETRHEQMSALRKERGDQTREQVCAIHNETRTQLADVLSEEQMAALEELKQDRPPRRRGPGRGQHRRPALDCD